MSLPALSCLGLPTPSNDDDDDDDDTDDDDQFERGSSLQSSNEYLPHLNKHTE